MTAHRRDIEDLQNLLRRIEFAQVDLFHGDGEVNEIEVHQMRQEAARTGANLALNQLFKSSNSLTPLQEI